MKNVIEEYLDDLLDFSLIMMRAVDDETT